MRRVHVGVSKYCQYCVLIQLSILKTDCDTFLMSKCFRASISCLATTLRGDTTSNSETHTYWGHHVVIRYKYLYQNVYVGWFHLTKNILRKILSFLSVDFCKNMNYRLEFACSHFTSGSGVSAVMRIKHMTRNVSLCRALWLYSSLSSTPAAIISTVIIIIRQGCWLMAFLSIPTQ